MKSNVQVIREAARHLLCVIDEMGFKPWCADDPLAIACDKLDAALALPLRNCDVGTSEEQKYRFKEYCDRHFDTGRYGCKECPVRDYIKGWGIPYCQLKWAQMPCEEGGNK